MRYVCKRANSKRISHWRSYSFCCILVLLSACSSQPVIVDYDTKQDFSKLHSYRWATIEEMQASNQQPATTPSIVEDNGSIPHQDLLSKRIKDSVNAVLHKQQININIAEPNFLIAHQLTTETSISRDYYNPFGIYLGGCSYNSYFCAGTTLRGDSFEYTYTELYLVLRFLNPRNHQVWWQGIVELPKNTSRKTAEEYDRQVQSAIETLLKRFPPATASRRPRKA